MNRIHLEEFTIKKMKIEDVDEILSIISSISFNPWSKNMFIEEILNPIAHCFVIRCNGDLKNQPIIGFICFRKIEEESELFNIYVHPQYRQLGIGKKLMKFYIDFCNREKINKFYLEVSASNQPAIHLYQSFSYQSVGSRKNFYQRKLDALIMVRQG